MLSGAATCLQRKKKTVAIADVMKADEQDDSSDIEKEISAFDTMVKDNSTSTSDVHDTADVSLTMVESHVHWKSEPLLVFSSLGFSMAGIVGFWFQQYVLGCTAVVTSMFSVLHWIDVIEGSWRHSADKIVASLSFVIFTVYGAIFVRDIWILLVGWPVWLVIVAMFITSGQLYKRGKSTWRIAHAAFHASVSVGQALVIIGIHRSTVP